MKLMIIGAVVLALSASTAVEPKPEPVWGTVCFDARGNPFTTSQGGGWCDVVDLNEWSKTHPDSCGPYNNGSCE